MIKNLPILLAVLLAIPFIMGSFIYFNGTTAGGGGSCVEAFYDTFATDTTANYTTVTSGSYTWDNINLSINIPPATGSFFSDTPNASDDGWACIQFVDAPNPPGIHRNSLAFRRAVGVQFYVARVSGSETRWAVCTSDGSSCTTVAQGANTTYGNASGNSGITDNDVLCAKWSGAGASIAVTAYDCGITNPRDDPSLTCTQITGASWSNPNTQINTGTYIGFGNYSSGSPADVGEISFGHCP